MVWANPRSLTTTYGITICFLFLWVLRCFSSPGLLLLIYRDTLHRQGGLPHSEICGSNRTTNPRNLSQFITSFIASKSQGILHTPLLISYLLLKWKYAKFLKRNLPTLFCFYNTSKNMSRKTTHAD